MRLLAVLVLALWVVPAFAQAPADSTQRRLELTNGTVYVGEIVAETEAEVTLRTRDGLIVTVPRTQIRNLGVPLPGGFTRTDPSDSRLFLLPTGRTMGARRGRVTTTYLVFPTVSAGLGDRVDASLGGSLPVAGYMLLLGNLKGQVVRTPTATAAVGLSFYTFLGDESGGTAGTFYGTVTLGSQVQAVTLGAVGSYILSDESDIPPAGALVIGYERQLSDNVKFISENYIGLGRDDEGSYNPLTDTYDAEWTAALALLQGVRFFGERLTADLAGALLIGGGDAFFVPVPYVSFSYNF